MAIDEKVIIGTWTLMHDGWVGTLDVALGRKQVAADNNCSYTFWDIAGTYTDQNGQVSQVGGYVQGHDPRRSGTCPWSDHLVQFTVRSSARSQTFEGYIFTRDQRRMAGLTSWQGIPFAWYATKK